MKEEGVFEEIDCYFAQRMLSPFPSLGEETHFFLCFLMALSRRGHLCINIDPSYLITFLNSLILNRAQNRNSDQRKTPELDNRAIEKMLLLGASRLPAELVDEVGFLPSNNLSKPICRFKTFYYLQKNWDFETSFLYHVNRLSSHQKDSQQLHISDVGIESSLNEEQKLALDLALKHPFSIISGGPGTGKTFTAARIVGAFLNQLSEEKRGETLIYLAAPTGKAASHMKKNMLRYFSENSSNKGEKFFCGTLHSLLHLNKTKEFGEERPPLCADLVIVDECSMIDAHLFSLLLGSLSKETKIVFMGDKNQLPPVEAGSFFADLVEMSEEGFPLPCAQLKTCMRSDRRHLLDVAKAIEQGDEKSALIQLASFKKEEKTFLGKDSKAAYSQIWHGVHSHFLIGENEISNSRLLLEKIDNFRILSSLRQGPYGVDALNQMIANLVWDHTAYGSKVCLPILITRSDRSLNLFNGETGILLVHKRSSSLPLSFFEKDDDAFFWDDDGNPRRIPSALLPSYEYAFCLSVHKSQGSEFNHVLLLIPPGTEAFGREVLYTAITRAKNSLQVEGDETILREAILRSSRKVSGLQERCR